MLFFAGISLRAQDREIGVMAGGMYYLGELNQKQFGNVKPAIGLSYRTTYQKRISWEQHLLVGTLNGADSLQSDPVMKNRNLSFRNRVAEVGTQLEINYFDYKMGSKRNFATPYLFFGFSLFYSNPEAQYQGKWYALRDIGTEGQKLGTGQKYNLINFAVPLGIGFKVSIGTRISLAVFSGFRKTFTDHLDDVGGSYADVSQFKPEDQVFVDRSLRKQRPDGTNTGLDRGNSNTKDWYNFTGISLHIKTNRKLSACDRVN
ncbi:MAG: DUF6089 family protein [Bacteroidota bacterium]